MKELICTENIINENFTHLGKFIVEPLEIGQGITLGNALKRILLTDLTGFAITSFKINGVKHEFGVLEGLREDIFEIILNLKEIIFKSSIFDNSMQKKWISNLIIKGPRIVTAGMLKLPKNQIKIVNPNQYICSISDETEFFLEIEIEKGKGYKFVEDSSKLESNNILSPLIASNLRIDALFAPIKNVNYKIKLIHDAFGNLKESLHLDILTNGSLTPLRGLQEAFKILLELIFPLVGNKNLLNISSSLAVSYLN